VCVVSLTHRDTDRHTHTHSSILRRYLYLAAFSMLSARLLFVLVVMMTMALGVNASDTGGQPAYCPEGSFIAPEGKCYDCNDFRDQVADCGKDCCGLYGCGTYVANAHGFTACFKRPMNVSAANVAVPICLGLAFVALATCAYYKRREALVCFQAAHFLSTIALIVTTVAACYYPVSLDTVDYSATRRTQNVVLATVLPLLLHALCAVISTCLITPLHDKFVVLLAGDLAPLIGLAYFCNSVRVNAGSQVPLTSPTTSTYLLLNLDPQYAANGLYYFTLVILALFCAVSSMGIWRAHRSHAATSRMQTQHGYQLGQV
jgi:hypothetical protein